MSDLEEKILNARIKLYNSVKYQTGNKNGFHRKEFETWTNNHKNETKILKDNDSLTFENVGIIMYKLAVQNNKYDDINFRENKNDELWLIKLKSEVENSKSKTKSVAVVASNSKTSGSKNEIFKPTTYKNTLKKIIM